MKVENDKIKIPYSDMNSFYTLTRVKSYCHAVDSCERCVFAVFDKDGDVKGCKVSYNETRPERWRIEMY